MRTLLTAIFIAFIVRSAYAGQSDPAVTGLRATMAERVKASVNGDSDKIANGMTPEYVQTDISGYVQDKAAWMAEYFNPLAELIKAGTFRWDTFEQDDIQYHVYGDCAVVTGVLHAKGSGATFVPQRHTWVSNPQGTFGGTLRFTHLYVRRNGRWLLAALHNAVPVTTSPAPVK